MVIIGKIGSPFGVQGWLKIQPFTEYEANILNYSPWYLSADPDKDDWKKAFLEESRLQADGFSVLAKFKEVNTPEAARLLTGQLIAITREQLPILPENNYYWSDLKNLTVINKDGKVLGKVIYLIETGSNDVLVVKGEKEFGIPFIRNSVILSVDLAKQEIHVDWEII